MATAGCIDSQGCVNIAVTPCSGCNCLVLCPPLTAAWAELQLALPVPVLRGCYRQDAAVQRWWIAQLRVESRSCIEYYLNTTTATSGRHVRRILVFQWR
eukprot:365438-Chlamydomonas_euryale.AAC.11